MIIVSNISCTSNIVNFCRVKSLHLSFYSSSSYSTHYLHHINSNSPSLSMVQRHKHITTLIHINFAEMDVCRTKIRLDISVSMCAYHTKKNIIATNGLTCAFIIHVVKDQKYKPYISTEVVGFVTL